MTLMKIASISSLAGRAPRLAPYLDRLAGPFAEVLSERDHWHIVVADESGVVRWASGRSQVAATALLAVRSLRPLRDAAPGVHPAHRSWPSARSDRVWPRSANGQPLAASNSRACTLQSRSDPSPRSQA